MRRLARIGGLLFAGLLLRGAISSVPAVEKSRRQSGRNVEVTIRKAFEIQAAWTPLALRRRFGFTAYQTKTALRHLVTEGFLTSSGRTRSTAYARTAPAALKISA
jgi:hypothetical protein